MTDLTIRHSMACDVDTYWRCVFDAEYNQRLYASMNFRECTVLDQKETDTTITRRVRLNPPPADLPGPVAKVVGDLSWVEEGTFDKATKRYRFKITTAALPEKTHISGEVWTEKTGEKTCDRVAKMSVEVKVMLIGSIIEKRIAEDTQKSYATAATFTGTFVRDKGW
jgi:Protein of unknown function (DUF2505)